MKEPRICVIGVEPGAKALSDAARARAARASLAVTAARHRPLLGEFPGEILLVEYKVAEAVERVASDPSLNAVFLASGDPGFFGIAALVAKKLGPGEVEVLPAVSSLQLAFARLGEPWSDARFASLHGRGLQGLCEVLGAPRVGLLTDGEHGPAAVAAFLEEAGWGDLDMAVCEDLGLETEKIRRGPVGDFLAWRGSSLNVVALLRNGPDPRPLGPGLPDEAFLHPRGRITKREARAAALSLLALPRRGVLWDVGAGSGSVGIEAALLAPALKVFAVERDEEAVGHVRENRRRLRAASLTVVPGAAPEALEALPDPDRVFIGGSGGNLAACLDLVAARLAPGGRVVVSTVLAETFCATLAWAKERGWGVEWTEIAASRSRPTGAGTRREAENPVTLLALAPPEGSNQP